MLSPTTTVTVVSIRSSPIPIPTIITVTVAVPKLSITPLAWTSAPAPAPTPSEAAIPPKQLPSQLPPNYLDMHKITITPAVTVILLVLPASGLAKISDWREIRNDRPTGVEPSLKCLDGGCRLILLPELNIHVSNHVIGKVVTDVKVLDLTELAQLLEYVLVEVLEVLLDLAGVDGLALRVHSGGDHIRALVHVRQQDGRGDRRPVVEP